MSSSSIALDWFPRFAWEPKAWTLCVLLSLAALCAQAAESIEAPHQKRVDFNHPPREFQTDCVRGWPLLIEKQLVDENCALSKRAVERLGSQLDQLFDLFPDSSHARLRELTLFLMYGEKATDGGRNNGLEYFQRVAPRFRKTLDPRMASAVLIYSATNYDWLPERRALMALAHEFAHAHQLEQWPERQPQILAAWENAMRLGLYRDVKDEKGKTLDHGYAAVNQLEYFAELSAVYFVGGYYHPFTREELEEYDPKGYAMVEEMWRVGAAVAE